MQVMNQRLCASTFSGFYYYAAFACKSIFVKTFQTAPSRARLRLGEYAKP
jgi:hypothetical protein